MTLENKYNRGTHGDSSHMLSTVVLSNENQTCRGWEAPPLQVERMSQRDSNIDINRKERLFAARKENETIRK